MTSKTRITVIGFGEVGSTVSALINTRFANIFFNIVDNSTEISGKILDFSNACSINENEVFENDTEMLLDSDYVIFCAGFSNKKGQSRNEVAYNNYQLIQEIFRPLRLKATAIVIVVTNPVELVSRWIYEALDKSNLVVGTGTSLDTFRFNDTIADQENAHISEIKTMLLGEHGEELVPIFSQSFTHKKPIRKELNNAKIDYYLRLVHNSANLIRQTENATKYGVAECVMLILKGFLEHKLIQAPFSVLLNGFFKEQLLDFDETYISLPCEIKNGDLSIQNIVFEPKEKEAMVKALTHLETLHHEVSGK